MPVSTAQQKQSQQAYARKLLDQVKHLDETVHNAYFDLGRLLSAIQHGGLYDLLGYDSMAELIDEELSFSRSQSYRYINTYRRFRALGYTKTESVELMAEFSFTKMWRYLMTAKEKVGKRAIKNAIERQDREHKQINFQLTEHQYKQLVRALEVFDAVTDSETGRLLGGSDALVKMANTIYMDYRRKHMQ